MKRILPPLYVAFFVILHSPLFAQITFQKVFGGAGSDISYSVQETYDGGYIIAGYTLSFGQGNRDVYLIRTDSIGNTLWTKTYGAGNTDYAWTVTQTPDSGYLVGAHSGSFGAGSHDIYLLRLNQSGNIMWERTYGGSSADGAYSLVNTSDGGFMISAHTSSFGAGQHDVYLLKLNSAGDTIWTKAFGGTSGDFLRDVQQLDDGGYICVAETFSFGVGSADVYLVRTDSVGNLLWAKAYGGSLADYGYSVRQTPDGGFIVAGHTSSFGAGQFDVYLIRTDSAGDTLWAKTYGGSSSDYGYSVALTDDGGFIVTGFTQSFGALGAGDVYLIRVDSSGNHVWSKTFGGSGADYGWCVRATTDNGFIITGHTSSFGAGGSDVYLIKIDSYGNTDCNQSDPETISGFASPTFVSATQTLIGSGSILNGATAIMETPATLDSLLCSNASCCTVAGDADNGGDVNIGDAIFIVKYAFEEGAPTPPCCDQADADGGGDVNIGDAIYIVKYAFVEDAPAPVCAVVSPVCL